MNKTDNSIRLGFKIENLELTIEKIRKTDWNILSEIKLYEWGKTAIIQDIDGRKIELKNK